MKNNIFKNFAEKIISTIKGTNNYYTDLNIPFNKIFVHSFTRSFKIANGAKKF